VKWAVLRIEVQRKIKMVLKKNEKEAECSGEIDY
jgi:hypothetical protein